MSANRTGRYEALVYTKAASIDYRSRAAGSRRTTARAYGASGRPVSAECGGGPAGEAEGAPAAASFIPRRASGAGSA